MDGAKTIARADAPPHAPPARHLTRANRSHHPTNPFPVAAPTGSI